MLLCFVGFGSTRLSAGNLLVGRVKQRWIAKELLDIAKREIGVRELTGLNDGVRVGEYQKAAACRKGDAWCACFVSWVFKTAGYARPRTGWSPDLFPAKRLVSEPIPGTVLGIYFPELKRIAHCGLVTGIKGDWITSCEGNTNIAGSREGDGVYQRIRHRKSIRRFAEWR